MRDTVRERDVEKYFVRQVAKVGGKAMKWSSPSNNGVPDRIVFLKYPLGPSVLFVELKAPGKKPTPLQQKVHEELRALGEKVYVVDSKAAVDKFLSEVAVV